MSRSRNRKRPVSAEPSAYDLARDELFQHIIRCDVIGAHPEHQAEWFADTMKYMSDRWHELTPTQLKELRTLGERFAQPARTAAATEAAPATDDADITEGSEASSDAESLDAVTASS